MQTPPLALTKLNVNATKILLYTHLLVESVMTPIALSLLPAVIDEPRDDGTFNVKLNSSCSSATVSTITGTLILLIVIPLANVAVSVVVIKSTPPVSQTFFNPHIMIHIILLPSADTGDCSDGVTVTLNG